MQNLGFSQWFCRTLSLAGVAVCVTLGTSHSTAASINYGDFAGITVTYQDVTESSLTDPLPLFGAPSVIGNTLDFDPQGFGAYSSGGGAPDLTDGQLNFGIQAWPGNAISGLWFSETGDFTLAGLGTSDTYVSASASVFVDIWQVDGVAITPIQVTGDMVFTPSASGDFDLPTYGGNGVIWSGHLSVDIAGALANAGVNYDFGATGVKIVLDNAVVAQSEANTTAFIAKKDFKGLTVTVVPEPASGALVLLGGLLFARKLRGR